MLQVREINNKKTWEEFLNKTEINFYPLFQSWDWSEIQKKSGFDILRLGLYEKEKLIGLSLIVDVKARRGHYFHLRHGPVLLEFKDKYFDFFIRHVKEIARERNAAFLRISPLVSKDDFKEFFKSRKFINAPIHNMDAETCWVLDIEKSEEELLKDMRKTHRYLVRKSLSMDIKVVRTKNMSDLDVFLKLYNNTSSRKHFVPHRGIKEEFEILCKNDEALLLLAEYEKKIIAGALIVFMGKMAIYHHGASLDEFKNIPASYLLQWEAINEAKKRGKTIYNFWGITPINQPDHPWKGITLFKTGFGGQRRDFIHAQDLPLNMGYWKSYLIELYTKWKKGY